MIEGIFREAQLRVESPRGRTAMKAARARPNLRHWVQVVAAAIICAAIPALPAIPAISASAAAAAPVKPYGTNDAGGFRNVLPAGENGLDNAAQLAEFQLNGTFPPHFADQLPLYADLLYASPTLTRAQIPNYFKDATFGVKEGDLASTESP